MKISSSTRMQSCAFLEKITEQYNRETDILYYDVTNYYFEIDKQDDLRKKGAEKNNRKDPIVQMGLLLDKLGLPISYKLFPGNKHDSETLMPVLTEVKKKFGVGRIITVADKGLNCGDNIAFGTILGDGYIYSKSVRGASDEFKDWVLDEAGYYALVTSELDDTDEHIIEMYRGLWRVEESFKVTKSVLGARPVYLRSKEHINAHFLVCFISLLIARIVERRLHGKYTISKITDTLRNVACSHLDQNVWLFDFADRVTDDCNAAFSTDFGRKVMTLNEIKRNFALSINS